MNFLILLGLALGPGVAIALYIYVKDKHEREPIKLLLISFFYGILSTLVTLMISEAFDGEFALEKGNLVHEFFNAFFLVALVEEFSKFIFVRFILYNNKNFNEPFDGIVYAVMVGMGFATLENILYVFNYGIATGIARMFTAVPAHASFAILMGYFIGRAKFTHKRELYLSALALFSATLFHGAYDYFWFIADSKDAWTGVWIGAIVSLVVGLILSKNAIRIHQQASPFLVNNELSNNHDDKA